MTKPELDAPSLQSMEGYLQTSMEVWVNNNRVVLGNPGNIRSGISICIVVHFIKATCKYLEVLSSFGMVMSAWILLHLILFLSLCGMWSLFHLPLSGSLWATWSAMALHFSWSGVWYFVSLLIVSTHYDCYMKNRWIISCPATCYVVILRSLRVVHLHVPLCRHWIGLLWNVSDSLHTSLSSDR